MSESMDAPFTTEARDQDAKRMTAGMLLRDARVAAGLHIAALSVALRVPASKLEALESDNFSVLPDMVFARALASSVCRTLKLDPQPVLALLPQREGPRLYVDDTSLSMPFRGGASKSSFAVPGSMLLTGGLLLFSAVMMFFLPRGLETDLLNFFKQPKPNAATSNAVLGKGQDRQAEVPPPLAASVSVSNAEVPVFTRDSIESTGRASFVAAVPSVSASAVTPQAADAPASALTFKARGESWIQVRDATGAVILQRNLAPDELVSASGVLPLAVVIGRADATDVFVRGQLYDLGPVSRENVARFEVK